VWAAYPAVVERKVVNASRSPAIWTLPGALRLIHDPEASAVERRRAWDITAMTRRTLVEDILRHCPDPIFADERRRKPYFDRPFDFVAFLRTDPQFPKYRPGSKAGIYRIYHLAGPCGADPRHSQPE